MTEENEVTSASAATPPTAAFVASPSSPKGLDQRLQSTGGEKLDAMLKALAAKRGTALQWITRSNAVTAFIASLPPQTRVFCRGEVHLPDKGHYPAVLTYNPIYKQTLAWAPSDRKDRMEAHHVEFFRSSVPHEGIAREVLMDRGTRVVSL